MFMNGSFDNKRMNKNKHMLIGKKYTKMKLYYRQQIPKLTMYIKMEFLLRPNIEECVHSSENYNDRKIMVIKL